VGLVSVLIISYISDIHKCSVKTMEDNNDVFPLLHVFKRLGLRRRIWFCGYEEVSQGRNLIKNTVTC